MSRHRNMKAYIDEAALEDYDGYDDYDDYDDESAYEDKDSSSKGADRTAQLMDYRPGLDRPAAAHKPHHSASSGHGKQAAFVTSKSCLESGTTSSSAKDSDQAKSVYLYAFSRWLEDEIRTLVQAASWHVVITSSDVTYKPRQRLRAMSQPSLLAPTRNAFTSKALDVRQGAWALTEPSKSSANSASLLELARRHVVTNQSTSMLLSAARVHAREAPRSFPTSASQSNFAPLTLPSLQTRPAYSTLSSFKPKLTHDLPTQKTSISSPIKRFFVDISNFLRSAYFESRSRESVSPTTPPLRRLHWARQPTYNANTFDLFFDLDAHTKLPVSSSKVFSFDSPSPDDAFTAQAWARSHAKAQRPSKIAPSPVKVAPTTLLSTPRPASSPTSSPGKTTKSIQKKKLNVAALARERAASKECEGGQALSFVIIGHVDAGKSTIMGHLLYLLKAVPEIEVRKLGKHGATPWAWLLDATSEERDRGVTMDVATTEFATSKRQYVLHDAPGHRDFVPSMLSGTATADAAVLVVDARVGEFEAGFSESSPSTTGGQTREHALLARSLGIIQLVVAVNKMDAVEWARERFEEIQAVLEPFLKSIGFATSSVVYIPLSGESGANLLEPKDAPSWWRAPPYPGQSLAQCLDTLPTPQRDFDAPLFMRVADVAKSSVGGMAGVMLSGRIDCGTIQLGDALVLCPSMQRGVVKWISLGGTPHVSSSTTHNARSQPTEWASAGDYTTLILSDLDLAECAVGDVLAEPTAPARAYQRVVARVRMFDSAPVVLSPGLSSLIMYVGGASVAVNVEGLVSLVSNANPTVVVKQSPRLLAKNTTGIVKLRLQQPVCMQTAPGPSTASAKTRFTLRRNGASVCAGIVVETVE